MGSRWIAYEQEQKGLAGPQSWCHCCHREVNPHDANTRTDWRRKQESLPVIHNPGILRHEPPFPRIHPRQSQGTRPNNSWGPQLVSLDEARTQAMGGNLLTSRRRSHRHVQEHTCNSFAPGSSEETAHRSQPCHPAIQDSIGCWMEERKDAIFRFPFPFPCWPASFRHFTSGIDLQ